MQFIYTSVCEKQNIFSLISKAAIEKSYTVSALSSASY